MPQLYSTNPRDYYEMNSHAYPAIFWHGANAPLPTLPDQFSTASGASLPRIRSLALSAIIMVDALRLAEIMRGMIEASTTRSPCSPCTRSWSSTTAHELSAGPIRQLHPGWNVVVPR